MMLSVIKNRADDSKMSHKMYSRFCKTLFHHLSVHVRSDWTSSAPKTSGAIAVVCGALGHLWMKKLHQTPETPVVWDSHSPPPQTFMTEDVLLAVDSSENKRREMWTRWDDNELLSKAQADISAVWNRIPDCFHVMERPRVTLQQKQLSIRFCFLQQVDMLHFMMQLAHTLSKERPSEHQLKDFEIGIAPIDGGVSTLLSFNCVHPSSTVSVQVVIPMTVEAQPEIVIVKEGPLLPGDLTFLEFLLRATSKAQSSHQFFDSWMKSSPEDDVFEAAELTMKQLVESFPFDDLQARLDDWSTLDTRQPQIRHRPQKHTAEQNALDEAEKLIQRLETMGAIVYRPNPTEKLQWGVLAGYEKQKRRIEDGLLFPLLHPQVSESIAKRTRKHYKSNRPRGVLFEGPPGTGKTTSARLIAEQASVHLIYLPLESILSKWYGESEKLLSEAFRLAESLDGSIIFFDEIETLGMKRNDEMHEASRRLLSLLLREMEGFDSSKKIIVIGATNRKQDVDAALLSRFDSAIRFDLPDLGCRRLIIRQYAQQLTDEDIHELAKRTEGMSGRDLRDVCEMTERLWASKIVRGEAKNGELPQMAQYEQSVDTRLDSQEF